MSDGSERERMGPEELREATFPRARRGYDRRAVREFLDEVASWIEGQSGGTPAAGGARGLTSEFAKVGERTTGILTAAEDAAAKLRADAKEYADRLRSTASKDVEQLKQKAQADAKKAQADADRLLADAQMSAERMIDEAENRRRKLNQAVADLLDRREELATEAQRLAEDLQETAAAIRAADPLQDELTEDEPVEGDEAAASDRLLFDDGNPHSQAERDRLARAGFGASIRSTEPESPDEPHEERQR